MKKSRITIPIIVGEGLSGAIFGRPRTHRYSLWRRWMDDCPASAMVAFIGLNPSTANETEDDPTVRRCIGFAKNWGFGGLLMLNLFAFRATDPKAMRTADDPIGPLNNDAIRRGASVCAQTICCWGVHGAYKSRGLDVSSRLLRSAFHLGLTKDGHLKHPLYLRADTKRKKWVK